MAAISNPPEPASSPHTRHEVSSKANELSSSASQLLVWAYGRWNPLQHARSTRLFLIHGPCAESGLVSWVLQRLDPHLPELLVAGSRVTCDETASSGAVRLGPSHVTSRRNEGRASVRDGKDHGASSQILGVHGSGDPKYLDLTLRPKSPPLRLPGWAQARVPILLLLPYDGCHRLARFSAISLVLDYLVQ